MEAAHHSSRAPLWHRGWAKLRLFLQEVRFEHTIFTLPFAYLTLLLVSGGLPLWGDLLWITLAMAGIRNFGMAANRVVDLAIDARNPRTRGRGLVSGRIRPWEMGLFLAATLGAFLVAVYNLSPWAQRLWPVVVALVVLYPYGKRFTWASHLGLGMVYMVVPNGVWVAVAGGLSTASVLLGLGAGFWAAGFDVIYACQDVEVDRRDRLHSIPADLGVARGLLASRLFHLLAVGFLAAAGVSLEAGPIYYAGVAAFLALLAMEHRLVSPADVSRANAAFFNMNGIVSIVFLAFVAAEVLAA